MPGHDEGSKRSHLVLFSHSSLAYGYLAVMREARPNQCERADVHRPKQTAVISTLYTIEGAIGDEDELESTLITSESEINGHHIVLDTCQVDRARIIAASHIRLTRSTLRVVDAANADIEQSGWRDVTVSESRLTGAKLNGSVLSNVVFMETRMNLMQIQNAKMKNVRFERCDLRGAYFNGSSLPGTIFEGSNLTGADFSGADITGSDLRRAIIEDIRIAPDQLNKVIVSSDQALYLARLFGLDVQE